MVFYSPNKLTIWNWIDILRFISITFCDYLLGKILILNYPMGNNRAIILKSDYIISFYFSGIHILYIYNTSNRESWFHTSGFNIIYFISQYSRKCKRDRYSNNCNQD